MMKKLSPSSLALGLGLLCITPNIEAQKNSNIVNITANEFLQQLLKTAGLEEDTINYTWDENDSVQIFERELKEFEFEHLPILNDSTRFTDKDRKKAITNLVSHTVTREVDEFNRPEFDSDKVFQSAANPKTWNQDGGVLIESFQGSSPYTVVLIRDDHMADDLTEEEIAKVEETQDDIARIMNKAIQIGPVTSAVEGFPQKERDINIPTKTIRTKDTKTIGEKQEENFDLNHPDIQSFGLTDEAVKDSLYFMHDTKKLIVSVFSKNKSDLTSEELFEEIEWPNNLEKKEKEKLFIDSLILKIFKTSDVLFTTDKKIQFLKEINKERNRLRFDSRNREAAEYIQKLGESTNPAIITVKHGANHFVPEYGKTMQKSLREANISYVLINPNSLQE